MKKGGTQHTPALFAALGDLDAELKRLTKEKFSLKKSLTQASSMINADREKEKALQEKIAQLIEQEAKLNQKRKNLESKVDKISDKMGKISKVKSEISDI